MVIGDSDCTSDPTIQGSLTTGTEGAVPSTTPSTSSHVDIPATASNSASQTAGASSRLEQHHHRSCPDTDEGCGGSGRPTSRHQQCTGTDEGCDGNGRPPDHHQQCNDTDEGCVGTSRPPGTPTIVLDPSTEAAIDELLTNAQSNASARPTSTSESDPRQHQRTGTPGTREDPESA